MSDYIPYDAGGGSGADTLLLDELSKMQLEMYKRTITLAPSTIVNKEQELRQLSVVEKPLTITVNVARDDFPQVNADIVVKFLKSTAQASWRQFLRDIMNTLNLQFIDGIIDRADNSPIHCILRLRHKSQYFVRQREESAILEAIQTGIIPAQQTWPIIQEITNAAEDLNFHCKHRGIMREKVTELITQPATRKQERDATNAILKAQDPQIILDTVHEGML